MHFWPDVRDTQDHVKVLCHHEKAVVVPSCVLEN